MAAIGRQPLQTECKGREISNRRSQISNLSFEIFEIGKLISRGVPFTLPVPALDRHRVVGLPDREQSELGF
jgi:hypothetical protein